MKNKGMALLLETSLTLAGLALSFLGALIKGIRQNRLTSYPLSLTGAVLSLFILGFGLLSLMGKESFALTLIIIGLIGLFISLAKLLLAFGQIGWIVALHFFNTKK